MLPSLLRTLSENKHREYPQNLFEIGEIFRLNPKSETGCEEEVSLAVVLSEEEVTYTKAKQMIDNVFKALSLEASVTEANHPSFIKGRVGKVVIGHTDIGVIGELAPDVLNNFSIIMPVSCFEINLIKLHGLLKKNS
jgi:phenylalanyl-tRNA synthetase beta chain